MTSGSVCRFYSTGTGPNAGMGKVDSAFYPYCNGSINEYQTILGTSTQGVSLQTAYLIGISDHASQRPIVTCTGKSTEGPGLHKLLRN
ncbi:hypothetical protein TNCV_639841 [Trichonephila clavipes]|nr:hypothetical protein TNCV_639841 [Trichonephila clavipes]